MPSGSHGGGGGGSHFGGGSSGGSHFGGGSHSSGSFRPRGPRIIVFGGRRVYISSNRASAQSFLVILAFVLFFITTIFGICMAGNLSDIKTIERDYNRYQSMIEYAESHDGYIIDAEFETFHYNDEVDKYYFYYSFRTATGSEMRGYTYSIYTFEEVRALEELGTIKIAVDSVPVTLSTDSIPIDYKNHTLEDDGEYANAKSAKTGTTVGFVVVLVAFVGTVVGLILTYTTAKPATEEIEKSLDKTSTEPNPTTAKQSELTWQCEYCGNVQSTSNSQCKQCGAPRRK